MSYAFTNANNTSIDYGDTTIFDGLTTVSFSAWINPDNISSDHGIITKRNTNGFLLFCDDNAGGGNTDVFRSYYQQSSETTTSLLSASGAYSAGVWSHVGTSLLFNNATGMRLYVDGTDVGSTGDMSTHASYADSNSNLMIGEEQGFSRNADGKIAECAAWNVILDAEEFAALAAGVSPTLIRPSALIWYVPLLRNLYNDFRSGLTGTLSATPPTPDAHPRMIYHRHRRVFHPSLGGAAPPAAQQFMMFPPRLDGLGRGGIFPGNRVQ